MKSSLAAAAKIARVAVIGLRVYAHGRLRGHSIDLSIRALAHCKSCDRYWWAI